MKKLLVVVTLFLATTGIVSSLFPQIGYAIAFEERDLSKTGCGGNWPDEVTKADYITLAGGGNEKAAWGLWQAALNCHKEPPTEEVWLETINHLLKVLAAAVVAYLAFRLTR